MLSVPIGNIADVTARVVENLNKSQMICVEDTRSFKILASLIGIPLDGKKIISFHDHTTEDKIARLAQEAVDGDLCVVSEAGSPIISDPAFPLVRRVLELGGRVESCPGPSSVIMSLELSGLPPIPFTFEGFLPREKSEVKKIFERSALLGGTFIYFDSPDRIENDLNVLKDLCPDAQVFVGRELTKKFESHYRFVAKNYTPSEMVFKGEFVLVVYFPKVQGGNTSISKELISDIEEYLDAPVKGQKELAKIFSKILDKSSKEIFKRLIT